jgi:hypothetical protein
MRRALEICGYLAAVVLIGFGIAAIAMGANGRSSVSSNLKYQKITGTPDMTPAAITAEAKKSGLDTASIPIPTCSVANQAVTDGTSARCFAQYMTIHALEATGGQLYSQMPRYAAKTGSAGTDNAADAQIGPNGQPVDNPARDVWIQQTALATALNASYMADRISLFGIVVGIALLLAGIGFGVLTAFSSLHMPARREERAGAAPAATATPASA